MLVAKTRIVYLVLVSFNSNGVCVPGGAAKSRFIDILYALLGKLHLSRLQPPSRSLADLRGNQPERMKPKLGRRGLRTLNAIWVLLLRLCSLARSASKEGVQGICRSFLSSTGPKDHERREPQTRKRRLFQG